MLVPCGHSTNGKIYYQYICQRLAKRGYLAISWDPVGQGERSQFWDKSAGKSRYNLVCGEHAILGNLAYLAGANLVRWETWDGIRALDYLLSRPDVDSARISITGTERRRSPGGLPGGARRAHLGCRALLLHQQSPDEDGKPDLRRSRQRSRTGRLPHGLRTESTTPAFC